MKATELRIKATQPKNGNQQGKKNPMTKLRTQLVQMLNSHFIPNPNRWIVTFCYRWIIHFKLMLRLCLFSVSVLVLHALVDITNAMTVNQTEIEQFNSQTQPYLDHISAIYDRKQEGATWVFSYILDQLNSLSAKSPPFAYLQLGWNTILVNTKCQYICAWCFWCGYNATEIALVQCHVVICSEGGQSVTIHFYHIFFFWWNIFFYLIGKIYLQTI